MHLNDNKCSELLKVGREQQHLTYNQILFQIELASMGNMSIYSKYTTIFGSKILPKILGKKREQNAPFA